MKARIFKRAVCLMELHRGTSYGDIATSLGISRQVTYTMVSRYRAEGLQMWRKSNCRFRMEEG
ncbi:MAG: hypothetical protein RLY31_770 [Bacteroidota bacterium]|jgi:transposase